MKKYLYTAVSSLLALSSNSQLHLADPQIIINEIGIGTSPAENFVE